MMRQEAAWLYSRHRFKDASNQIRLLRFLEPLDDDPDDGIRCQMGVYERKEKGFQYVAISYTWGSEQPTRVVHIDGAAIEVRENAWRALFQLRKYRRDLLRNNLILENRLELYWMDSICMNQDDKVEKQHQVAQMGHLYANAAMVAACIGPLGHGIWDIQKGQGIATDRFGAVSVPGQSTTATSDEVIECYIQLAKREYFKRVWIVQEISLAQELEFFMGGLCIPCEYLWKQIRKVAELIPAGVDQRDHHLRDLDKHLGQSFPLVGNRDFAGAIVGEIGLFGWNLPATILQYSGRGCKEPRDRVYGFLALISKERSERINIDYSQSLLQVLLNYVASHSNLNNDGAVASTDKFRPPAAEVGQNYLSTVTASIRCLAEAFAAASPDFTKDLDCLLRSYLSESYQGTSDKTNQQTENLSYVDISATIKASTVDECRQLRSRPSLQNRMPKDHCDALALDSVLDRVRRHCGDVVPAMASKVPPTTWERQSTRVFMTTSDLLLVSLYGPPRNREDLLGLMQAFHVSPAKTEPAGE